MSERKFVETPDSFVDNAFVNAVGEKKKVDNKNPNFDYGFKKVRSVFDLPSAPSSVSDWEHNEYVIDSAGYVPIDKMIKRMIQDGERLEEFRLSADYQALFEKTDDELPYDDFMFQDRAELLVSARELQSQLDEIRAKRSSSGVPKEEHSTKAETPPIPDSDKETVSTADK